MLGLNLLLNDMPRGMQQGYALLNNLKIRGMQLLNDFIFNDYKRVVYDKIKNVLQSKLMIMFL